MSDFIKKEDQSGIEKKDKTAGQIPIPGEDKKDRDYAGFLRNIWAKFTRVWNLPGMDGGKKQEWMGQKNRRQHRQTGCFWQ